MPSEELEQLRLEIAKYYYVEHVYSETPTKYENLARESFELADIL